MVSAALPLSIVQRVWIPIHFYKSRPTIVTLVLGDVPHVLNVVHVIHVVHVFPIFHVLNTYSMYPNLGLRRNPQNAALAGWDEQITPVRLPRLLEHL